ncbi:MAG: AraC family transcriptional regulator [Spirochaetales bacterium]|nr:AraC family transcriptional regulator [Spirochaetales bacterium]
MWETFFFVFLIMGAGWTISGVGNLVLKNREREKGKSAALFVLVVFFLNILDNLIRPGVFSREFAEAIYHFSRPSYLLVGPAFLFYVRALLREKGAFKFSTAFHFIPFTLGLIHFLRFPSTLHPEIKFASDNINAGPALNMDSPPVAPLTGFDFHWDFWKNISLIAYTVVVLFLIYRHRKRVPDLFSSLDKYTTLSWFQYLLFFYSGIYIINMVLHTLLPDSSPIHQASMALVRVLPPVGFVFFFSLFSGIQQVRVPLPEASPVSTGCPKESLPVTEEKKEKKYEKSGMGIEEVRELFQQLKGYLEEEKSYLDPELTLEELANLMGETRHRLSEVINRESGDKFYRFINHYRLEEFKSAIEENRFPDYTILAVAFECGFRSQSAFYNLFKKEEGMTPRAYVLRVSEKEAG